MIFDEHKYSGMAIEKLIKVIEEQQNENHQTKTKHRKTLKRIREALCTVKLFSPDNNKEREDACQEINEILEEFDI